MAWRSRRPAIRSSRGASNRTAIPNTSSRHGAAKPRLRASRSRPRRSDDGDVFQQRDHADDDHDDARDLLGAAIQRQQVDQVRNQNDDQKRHECADQQEICRRLWASSSRQRRKAGAVPSTGTGKLRLTRVGSSTAGVPCEMFTVFGPDQREFRWGLTMLKRLTVSALLQGVILITAFCVVTGFSLNAWDSWNRLQVTGRIVLIADTSANVFKAMHNLRTDRSSTNRLLNSDQPVDNEMDKYLRGLRGAEMPAMSSALEVLPSIEFAQQTTLVPELDRLFKILTGQQKEFWDQMNYPEGVA